MVSWTPASPAEASLEVKGSRFRAHAVHVATPEEAAAWISTHSVKDATHNTWAWRVGPRYRFSDDGEPGGTAGRPILSAIDGQRYDQVAVLVTRWFGGQKLGTGGLARAYGGVAARCLELSARLELCARIGLHLAAPFEAAGPLFNALDRMAAQSDHPLARGPEQWSDEGVTLTIEIDERASREVIQALRNATRGAVVLSQTLKRKLTTSPERMR